MWRNPCFLAIIDALRLLLIITLVLEVVGSRVFALFSHLLLQPLYLELRQRLLQRFGQVLQLLSQLGQAFADA